jgi:superfamily I DNA/RNA helicase
MSAAEELNAQQRPAVEAGDGPLVIVAGPGTGKTKTLTARIAHLVQTEHVQPDRILALTFTNKAAQEMQSRVLARLSQDAAADKTAAGQKPLIATFHALAHVLLDLPEKAKLIDNIERLVILQQIKDGKQVKHMNVRDIGLTISRAKNQAGDHHVDAKTKALVEAYNAELRTHDSYDYDDLLIWLHESLGEVEFRKKAQRFDHILVDEFQDTNELQYDIVRRLNRTDNLFVIGDPLQSIYGFRGANAQIFDRFMADFPQAARVRLTTNYRSAPEIVRLSGAIFPDMPVLTAHRSDPGKAQVIDVLNEYGEADWIVHEIERQVGGSDMLRSSQHHDNSSQRTFDSFAVMSRTHAGVLTVRAALEKSGIPYQVVGEGSPYLEPHAAAIIQSFAYLTDFAPAPSVRKLTSAQVARLLDPLKPFAHKEPLTALAAQITDILKLADDKNKATVRQFANTLVRYNDMPTGVYVQHVRTLAEQEFYDPAAGAVTLLTIHAAKGLEFPVVFLAGAEEGSLPLTHKGLIADVEEEKRLFYVAVTRARDELYILHARTRRAATRELSSFVAVLPPDVLERVRDPAMDAQLKRIKKRAQKRAQGSLF